MIERFNFYDIYGYLIPGFTFVLLLWLPYGVVNHSLPDDKLSAAVAAIVVGYIVGHLIVAMAGELISGMTARDKDGKPQYPSVVVLDHSNSTLYAETKQQIGKNVHDWFGLDVAADTDADKGITGTRQTAFFRCRPIVNKSIGYAEQFQGLYSMMSGLTVTFGLGVFYIAGWAAAGLLNVDALLFARWGLSLSLGATVALAGFRIVKHFAKKEESRPWDAATVTVFALFLMNAGYLLAVDAPEPRNLGAAFCVIAVLCLAAALRCFNSFRYFANEFAAAVWRYLPAKGDPPAKDPG